MNVKPIGSIDSPFTEGEAAPIQASTAQGAQGGVHVLPEFADGPDEITLVAFIDPPAGRGHVGLREGVLNRLRIKPVEIDQIRIQAAADFRDGTPGQKRARDTPQTFEFRPNGAVGEQVQVLERNALSMQCKSQNGDIVGIVAKNLRRLGQFLNVEAAHGFLDVQEGEIHVRSPIEIDLDHSAVGTGDAGDLIDVPDGGERALELFRHHPLDFLRGEPRRVGDHRDARRAQVREEAGGQVG